MAGKTYVPEGEVAPASQIGTTMEALAATIAARRDAGEESYTYLLLTDSPDRVLKKVCEESIEVALAAKDVESQATSAIAASLAFRAASENAQGEEDDASLSVALSEDYSRSVDHLRYEAADVVYHLLVVLERYGIGLDEFAAELNERMAEGERPAGAVRLVSGAVNRGK